MDNITKGLIIGFTGTILAFPITRYGVPEDALAFIGALFFAPLCYIISLKIIEQKNIKERLICLNK